MDLFDKYDGYEVQPCCHVGACDAQGKQCVEVCDEHEAEFWTVYGHINGQGVEALADCPTAEIANEIRDALLVMDYEGKRCLR